MKQSKHTTQDPMAEKYMGYSPYNYCVNSPINFVDPNGMGDFWFNGVIIGNDGIDDKRVLVIKTTAKSFGNKEDLCYVLGAGLSNKEQKTTVDFIKKNSGNTEAFQKNPIAYNNSIEIEGSARKRQLMVNIVMADNGQGGTSDANNREYGGYITSTGDVIEESPGPVMKPGYAYILLNNGDNTSTFHSHPSGELYNYEAGIETISFHVQHPSQTDIDDAKNGTHYVFGRRNKNVYVYTRNGIQAVIPMKNFVNPKTRKTK